MVQNGRLLDRCRPLLKESELQTRAVKQKRHLVSTSSSSDYIIDIHGKFGIVTENHRYSASFVNRFFFSRKKYRTLHQNVTSMKALPVLVSVVIKIPNHT
jgi:hypothetical protein